MVRRPASLTTFALLVVFPLGIQFGDEDSTSSTSIGVSGGGGHYAALLKNCEGETVEKEKREFGEGEVDFSYQKRFGGRRALRFRLGVGAANFSDVDTPRLGNESDFWFFRPGIRFDFSHLGLGVGLLRTSEPIPSGDHDWLWGDDDFSEILPTGTLWVGSLRTVYVDFSFYHDGPLLSSGAVTTGLGAKLGKRVHAWAGISDIGPYSAAGFLLRSDVRMTRRLDLGAQLRFGGASGIDETSFNLGLAYRVH
jgi:hypothetical protein